MNLLEKISARRSLPPKRMNGKPVSVADLMILLEAANWAPSHRHTEPWRFVVFHQSGLARLGECLEAAYQQHAVEVLTQKIEKIRLRVTLAGAAIGLILSPPQPARNPVEEEIMALACGVQNLHLQAQELGIGGYWTTPKFVNHELMQTLMAMNSWETCLGIFYLGYPEGDWPTSKRRPVEQKVTFIGDQQ